jgi:uncharacterized heparinase superfamily protein
MNLILLYWNTLRHLRPVQIFGRVQFRLRHPRPDLRPPSERRSVISAFEFPAWRQPAMQAPKTFTFLNETGDVHDAQDWVAATRTRLWRYNLHYFDDLTAHNSDLRTPWHTALIERWIAENVPGKGTGWEPYPVSLRLVNWVKWLLCGHEAGRGMIDSIAVQSRWLERRLEHHLLGNHLVANAKALVFSGLFFEGDEADRWYELGMRILEREFKEQVLPDGGHFERSPMYHHLVLEDLLDLVHLHRVFDIAPPSAWADLVSRMLEWALIMSHPDGEIAFFNDAAFSVAPAFEQLRLRAASLGFPCPMLPEANAIHLRDSGYVRLSSPGAVLLADLAPIGPDHLPAHAHADTLSFELSLGGRRVVVNSGTSVYGTGPERQRQRSTPAHATLTLDDTNSSEVWGGFRVGRRARIHDVRVQDHSRRPSAEAAHDGYLHLPGRPSHKRTWQLDAGKLLIQDRIDGSGEHACRLVLPLGPGMTATHTHDGIIAVSDAGTSQPVATIEFRHNDVFIEPGTWHPRFGEAIPNFHIVVRIRTSLPWVHETQVRWRVP